MHALWVAKTGLDAQQTRMSVIANNLANVNTVGFKRSRAAFEDLIYQNVRQVGGRTSEDTQDPSGMSIGTGVRIVGTEKQFTQGNHMETGSPMDIMIQGRGFFQVLLPDGDLAYTRNGSFRVDAEGRLVTVNGYEIQPAISIPDGVKNISVGVDGTIEATISGQSGVLTLGAMQVTDFINPGGLEARGQNLYLETAASGTPQIGTPGLDGLGGLVQGALEGSNVNIVEELVSMIEAQRAYEMNSKAIASSDQMMQFINNNL